MSLQDINQEAFLGWLMGKIGTTGPITSLDSYVQKNQNPKFLEVLTRENIIEFTEKYDPSSLRKRSDNPQLDAFVLPFCTFLSLASTYLGFATIGSGEYDPKALTSVSAIFMGLLGTLVFPYVMLSNLSAGRHNEKVIRENRTTLANMAMNF